MLAAFALVLGAAGTGCVARSTMGGQCLFNGDCEGTLVCAGRFCRAACAGARDCPTGEECSPSDKPNSRVCLPAAAERLCVYSSDCPEPQVCLPGNKCGAQCQSNRDCAGYDPNVDGGVYCKLGVAVSGLDGGFLCSNHPHWFQTQDQ